MLWNLMMHTLMGWLGAYFFILTPERIGIAILAVCMTQAVDQVRLRKMKWAEIESLPEKERKSATAELEKTINRDLALTFAQNVVIYSSVVLFAAHAVRLNGWL
ncbi:hypothetical protein [Sedimenticola selenatireducens]|jgi:hypothetical protein|uniref:Uncharacterized protein n=1 Tax=Sedimenticola selenatireducens TaxID=191960 RepID=A0A557S501_9GAMM|nr:hypothetical protein [Sedimenticola selenatireducens]TVO72494.1 hypothetical protein FHP88_12940 [Sedimenticola selenatireducens]TVT64749.1 MAG: hypothetical protein FHK78_06705 [Sedimenticola selenatireducens]